MARQTESIVRLALASNRRYIPLTRFVPIAIAEALLVLAVWEVVVGGINFFGIDYGLYMRDAQRFLATGTPYSPLQLAGPYELGGEIFLYPPIALALFVPFTFLPALLWWVVPLGVIGVSVYRWRPAPWTWPLIAFAIAWPRTVELSWLGTPTCGFRRWWPWACSSAGRSRSCC